MEQATILIRRLGRLVRAARTELGLTQAQMAARCGLSAKHFGQIERGDAQASLSALHCLAQGLDMSLPEMLGHIEAPPRGGRPRLDFRRILRAQAALHMLSDHFDQLVTHAAALRLEVGAEEPRYRVRGEAGRRRFSPLQG